METAYVEGSLIIRIPFFGITVDVNDLGVLGGIGFLLILSCYRFFLHREIANLRISFTVARIKPEGSDQDSLASFYSLLAMRQVFTIPEGGHERRSNFLRYLPRLLTWIPTTLLFCVALHDLQTSWIGFALHSLRFQVEFLLQAVCVIATSLLADSINRHLRRMDKIWDAASALILATPAGKAEAESLWDEALGIQTDSPVHVESGA
jgi:hypothetical protein